jgi:predicted naringenin-chalcone synthase
VLLVAVEICTIAFRLDLLTKANIVASALFGDGAAAAVCLAVSRAATYREPETPGALRLVCAFR